MQPLDLTVGRPRAPIAELDGIMFLPRTLDKVRASLPGGNLAGYGIAPGISEALLEHFGVGLDAFTEAVKAAESEAGVVAWFRAYTDPAKIAAWNESLLARAVTDVNRERMTKRHPVLGRRPELVRVVDVLEADDRECAGEALAAEPG
jgi:hypothetical protein